jgi:hypothetical protein
MKHMTDFNSFINESAKSDKLVPLMLKAIDKVDDSLSYTEFAIAVATIIKDEYGDHNIKPFMAELQKQLSLKESKYNGNIAGDAAEYIAKELSQYVKGVLDQPNDSVTYFHLKDKSYKSKVIKTLKDVYGLEAQDGGTQFSPSPTIKFDNDIILEAKDSDTFVGNPSEDQRMVDIRAFRGSVKDLTDFIEDKIKETQQ